MGMIRKDRIRNEYVRGSLGVMSVCDAWTLDTKQTVMVWTCGQEAGGRCGLHGLEERER